MNKIILSIIAFLFSIEVFCQVNHHAVHLKVNNSTAPLGINTKLPSFNWQLHSVKRNTVQTSYHILVSDKEENLKNNIGNTWNSGEVKSSQSIQIKYSGRALQPSTTYYWKVKVQDTQQGAGEWSETATFQTGLFTKQDWKNAQWIAYEKLADEYIDVLPKDTKKDAYSGSNVAIAKKRL